MTNFKQYFSTHLKSKIKPICYILVVVLILTGLLGNAAQETTSYNSVTRKAEPAYASALYIPVVVMCILVCIVPVMQFSFFKKRTTLDCIYSLPISRRAMGLVHYLVGFIIVFGAYTLSYLLNFVMLLSRGAGWFDFSYIAPHYFLCLALGCAIYTFMVCVFNQANTKGDGIWFMILYTFIFNIGLNAIATIGNIKIKYALGSLYWSVFNYINVEYQSLVENINGHRPYFTGSIAPITWFVFWMIVGVISAVIFFTTFGRRRMEKTGEISDSYLGFPVLIPVYAVSTMIIVSKSNTIVWWVIIELLTFIGYTIYRRGFHYKKSDIIILCLLSIFLFI